MRAQDDRPVQTSIVRFVSISLGRAECGHNSDACDWFFFIYLGCHWVASVCPAVMVSGRYVPCSDIGRAEGLFVCKSSLARQGWQVPCPLDHRHSIIIPGSPFVRVSVSL
jgi:hypothetical protein